MTATAKSTLCVLAVLALGWAGGAQAREVYAGNVLAESGGTSRRLKIIVNEFTPPEETAHLLDVLREKGERGLELAMSKLDVGWMQIGDTHSYPIATAQVYENRELHTRRLVLVISRPISYNEFTRGGHSKDYPYTLVELAMDGPGIDDSGSGEMLAVAKIELEDDGTVKIENLEARPRRILKVSRSE
jgi:hypothetical protein